MKKFKADIIIKLKNGVRDPQGHAIETVLKRTGLDNNPQIRAGKFFSLVIESDSEESALKKFNEISREVLSNPILEEYEIIKVVKL